MTGQPIVFVVKRYSDIIAAFTSEAAAVEYADLMTQAEEGDDFPSEYRVLPVPFVVSPTAYGDAYRTEVRDG